MEHTTRTRGNLIRGGLLNLVLVVLLLGSGCSSSGSSGGDGGSGDKAGGASGSCARRVKFDSRIYSDVVDVQFKPGAVLGKGRTLSCDDSGGQGGGDDGAETLSVYEVPGLDSSDAVAVGDSPADAELFALEGKHVPAAVQSYIDAHR